MNTDYYNPHGVSLLDYHNGETEATVTIHNLTGRRLEIPVRIFFRGADEFAPVERKALELARGRVLDIGAGAGVHSLVMQERGLTVCAIDFLPECVQVMKERGVRDVRLADVFTFNPEEPFDTLLSMMSGIALAKTLDGVRPFLASLKRLVKADGQLLLDSTDLRENSGEMTASTVRARQKDGRYFGEIDMQLEYKGRRGEPFTQVYVDAETLKIHAAEAGWDCEIFELEDAPRFLARLTPKRKG